MVDVVAALLVLVALVAMVGWAVRRRGGDEVHSVDHYRHTLDTLQGIRSRSGPSPVRVLGGRDDPGQPLPDAGIDGEAVVPGSPPQGQPGGAERSLVFDGQAAGRPASPRASRRTQDRAISAMNHRPRRLGLPILSGVVVVGLLAAVVAIGAHDKGRTPTPTTHPARAAATTTSRPAAHGHTTTTPTTSTTRPRTGGSTTPTTSTGTGTGTGTGRRGTGSKRPATTTTAAPRTYTPVTSTATAATYAPVDPTYSVTLTTTTGDCWVTVRSASGSTLLSQTLPAGQSATVSATGKTSVIIGAPSVLDVTVDRVPVVLPSGFQTPFYMTLVPASS